MSSSSGPGFGPIGVSPFDEQVYRSVLRMPHATIPRLAAAETVSSAKVAAAVRRLQESGLVERTRPASPEVVPVDPRVAVAALVRARLAELDRLSGTADDLAQDFHEHGLRNDPDRLVKVVEGAEDVERWFGDLVEGATEEIQLLSAAPHVSTGDDYSESEIKEIIGRGVQLRTIYGADELSTPGRYANIMRDVRIGERARMLRVVPMKLLVVDRKRAFLPLTGSEHGARNGAIVVERSGLTDAMVRLFEALWGQAIPLSPDPGSMLARASTGQVSPEDLALLPLLQAGLKDDAISRQLGISERTLRRRITDLLERLGAASRFQAGVQAVRHGWI